MIRGILTFLALWAFVFMGISFFWHTSRSFKIDFVRVGVYSLVTAAIAFAILIGIVVLF